MPESKPSHPQPQGLIMLECSVKRKSCPMSSPSSRHAAPVASTNCAADSDLPPIASLVDSLIDQLCRPSSNCPHHHTITLYNSSIHPSSDLTISSSYPNRTSRACHFEYYILALPECVTSPPGPPRHSKDIANDVTNTNIAHFCTHTPFPSCITSERPGGLKG